VSGWREQIITTLLPSTAVFFHGTYRGAKSVVPRNTMMTTFLWRVIALKVVIALFSDADATSSALLLLLL